MISIGGTQEGGLGTLSDPWTNGLGIFDMTTLSWTNAYDAAAPAYEQPGLVSRFYTNNSRYPTEWGDPELKSIFKMPNGTANFSGGNNNRNDSSNSGGGGGDNKTGPGTTTNETASMSSGSGMPSSNGIAGGVAVGGVIGGVAALAIIVSLIYWMLCQSKRKEERSPKLTELEADQCIAGQVTCRALTRSDVGHQVINCYEVPGTPTISPTFYEMPI
jgi:hypothetical protein